MLARASLRKCLEKRGAELAQLLEPFELIELRPEVPRHVRRGTRGSLQQRVHEAEQRAAEVTRQQAGERGILRGDHDLLEVRIVEDRLHQLRDLERIPGVVQTPPPSIVAGTAVAANASTGTRL